MSGDCLAAGGPAVALSIILPAHNCQGHLADSVSFLQRGLAAGEAEVVIVENDSVDGTWPLARYLEGSTHGIPIRAIQSGKGLGRAYVAGIAAARCRHVLLTADDLPFGLSDIRAWRQQSAADLVLGSKAHPDWVVDRTLVRQAMSLVFRALRLVVLGMRVRDCQGTPFARREWLQDLAPHLREGGYLSSTEIVYAAQREGLTIVEVSVELRPSFSGTRIHVDDIVSMAVGLGRLRGAGSRLDRPCVPAMPTDSVA